MYITYIRWMAAISDSELFLPPTDPQINEDDDREIMRMQF